MKKLLGFIVVFFILLLASCGKKTNIEETTKVVDNTFINDNYNMKITYTVKMAETYGYKYVHDCRIQIKAKPDASSEACKVRLSIYDGEADVFSEEIITRYYTFYKQTNLDETIEDVYTNELLLAHSQEMNVVDSIGDDYTKNFLDKKTITFNSNGGSYIEPKTVSLANKYLPSPSRTGYSFDGWYDKDLQNEIYKFDDLKDGMTLYAKWHLLNYTINYSITSDVTNDNISKYNIETNTFTLNEPTRTGYTFKGWYTNKDFTGNAITRIPKGSWGNFTLYPQWEANTYDVELVFNDGVTENTVVKVTYGKSYSNLPTPIRDGYIFEGWYLDENDYNSLVNKVNVADNHVLYAKWIEGTSELTYSKTSNGVEITGCSNKDVTSILIPTSIGGVDVVSIKPQAFSGMNKITEVVIPNSVTSIGEGAFYNCSSIESFTVPSVYSFYTLGYYFGCSSDNIGLYQSQFSSQYTGYTPKSLKRVTITNATGIGWYAFRSLSNLEEVILPNTITSIGAYAFENCSGIIELDIPETVKTIGAYAFNNCANIGKIIIPSGVTEIETCSFYGLSKITEIKIPNGVISIGESAFSGCAGVAELIIPSYCTNIGKKAFSGMNKITEVVIPNSVTSIGEGAFYNCSSIESFTVPSVYSFYTLGYYFGCSSDNIGLYQSQFSSQYTGYTPKSLKRVTITNATGIGWYAFRSLSNLEEVILPNTITSIGAYAFENCKGLVKVYFNGTLEEWNQIISNSDGNTPLAYGAKLYVLENGDYLEVE